ncbi:gamma-glutamyl hydrolase A like protein, partial [Danaus plexippus plexippus]
KYKNYLLNVVSFIFYLFENYVLVKTIIYRYPFYGVQFHPEKISFEWKLSKNYPHSYDSLVANRHFMDFFVKECRYNYNSFSNAAEENQYLIYNYSPKFTGALGSAYHQCYLFEPRGSVASVKK